MRKALSLIVVCLLACVLLTSCGGAEVPVSGQIINALDNTPVAGAEIVIKGSSVQTDSDGAFELVVRGNHEYQLTISALGFEFAQLDLAVDDQGIELAAVSLEPCILQGNVQDRATGEPVAGAILTLGDESTVSNDAGLFEIMSSSQEDITIAASGFTTTTIPREDINALYDEVGLQKEDAAFELAPRTVAITVQDEQGATVSGAEVTSGSQTVLSGVDGTCEIQYIDPDTPITVTADGLRTIETQSGNETTLALKMEPWEAQIFVVDAANGDPLEATIIMDGDEISVPAEGLSLAIEPETMVTASCDRYTSAEVTFSGELLWEISLSSVDLTGSLTDGETGEPVVGALVQVYTGDEENDPVMQRTADDGTFTVQNVPTANEVYIKAPGYRTVSVPVTDTTELDLNLEPFEAQAIYVPFALLTVPEVITDLLDLVDRTALNSIVVDVRGDYSYIAWQSDNPIAQQVDNYYEGVMDLNDLVKECHERGIYVIARMVMFKDDIVATTITDWAIKAPADEGGLYYDYEGLTWLDPYLPEVVEYEADLMSEVLEFGFDEIQMDYLRFPSDGRAFSLIYSQESEYETRIAAIESFTAAMYDVVEPSRAFLSADVFGMTPWTDVDFDMGIGQRVEDIAPHVDYISPMLYPTTFANGSIGYADPSLYPYEVVYYSVIEMHTRTSTKIRPWLQHYSIYDYVYGTNELLEERKAAEDGGSCGWMFWNSGALYNETVMGYNPYSAYPNLPDLPAE